MMLLIKALVWTVVSFLLGVLGHLEFRHLTLHVFSDPDIRVTAHIPDAQTRAKLQRFRTTEESAHSEA